MGAAQGLFFGAVCLAVVAWVFHHYVVRLHDARTWLSRGAVLVDVDTADEFYRHHPRVALSLPLEALAQKALQVLRRDQPVVVFAHSWRRGAMAVHDLRGMGFSSVMNAAGLHTRESFAPVHAQTAAAKSQQHPDLMELARESKSDLLHPAADAPRNGQTDKHDTSLR